MKTTLVWIVIIAATAALSACAVAGTQPSCGDGACSADESCASCPGDCGGCVNSGSATGDEMPDATVLPPGPMCGDTACDADETCSSCPSDCGSCPPPAACGDSVCDVVGGECATCPADCSGICGVCGDGTCDSNEDEITCAADCEVVAGGMCSHSWCDLGGALAADCDPCVTAVCNLDLYCCLVEWDVSCKNALSSMCLQSC